MNYPPLEETRSKFEEYIKSSDRFKGNTPLGTMEINGKFDHYMNPNTDTMWIGFALGYRQALKDIMLTIQGRR